MRLKEYRVKNHLTTEKLGQMIGVTPSAITNWETGIRCPNLETLCNLARVLGCTPNDLLGFETPEETRAEIIARRMTEAREGSEG